MPQLIPVVIAIAASAATASAIGAATVVATIGGFAITGAMVAGAVGMVVSTVASMAMSAIMKPKKAAAAAMTPQAESEARKQTIRGGIEARQVIYGRTKVGGVIVYAASSGPKQEHLHLVVVLAGHPCDAVESVFLNDEEINLATQVSGADVIAGRFAGSLIIDRYTGGQTTANSFLVESSPDGWGADHVLAGCTYLYMRLTYDQDKFPQGLQSVAAVVRGKSDIYDPRTATTGYTDNWALCVLDYLSGSHGLECDADELDLPYFVAAANLSQENVQLNEEATVFQPRYTINGAFKLDQAPMDIIEKMLAAGAGTLVYVQGQYRLFGGAYSSPTVSLGPSDFAGDIELETRAPRRELFNSVRGTFIDPERAWQAAEFPPLVASGLVADDGEQIWRDLPLDFVTQGFRAQRLARIALLTSRDSLRVKAPVRYAGLRLAVWQMVSLTLPDFGWTAKPFRVEAWSFEPASGRVMLTLREENAFNYAWYWDSGASIPPVPDTSLVDPLTIPPVTGVTLTPGTVLQPDGSILPVLDISWTASAHPFVTAHEVQWSLPADEYVGQDVRMPSTRHTVRSVQAGQDYRARVRAVAGLVRGPWSGATVATSAPDTTPPATPTSLTATGIIRGVSLRWSNPTAPDFAKVEIEEGSSASGPWGKIGETPSDFFTRNNLAPSSSAWFRVRALDRSGNASAYSAAVLGTASYLIASDIADGIINTAKFAAGIAPVRLIASLTAGGAEDDLAYNTTDGRLYKRTDGAWVPLVSDATFSGQLTAAQIASVDASSILGLIAASQIDSIEAAQLAGQVVGAQISDNAIIASKIAAGAITTGKLSVASTNLIWNSCCTGDTRGWTRSGAVSNPALLSIGHWDAASAFRLASLGTGYIRYSGTLYGGEAIYANWDVIPVTPGTRWQAAALVQAHRCGVRLQINWYTGADVFISAVASTTTEAFSAAGVVDAQYTRLTLIADAPGTAFYARVFVSGLGNGGTDAYAMFTKTLFGPAPPNATEVGDWVPGGVTQVSGGQIVTRSILADRIVAGSLSAAEIAANAITAEKIAAGQIIAEKIGAGQVTADKIAANSVIAGKIAAGAVRAAEIFAGELRAYHLASDTIITETAQVANLIIGTEKISAGSLTTIYAASNFTNRVVGGGGVITPYDQVSICQLTMTVATGENGRFVLGWDANTTAIQSTIFWDTGGGGDGGSGGGSGE